MSTNRNKFQSESERRAALTPYMRLREVQQVITGSSTSRGRSWAARGVEFDLQYLVLGELEEVIKGGLGEGDTGEVNLWQVESIYEDLTTLAELVDQALSLTQGRLGDQVILEKIALLRNPSGRTDAEMETARKVADRLERKLTNRLEN